VAILAALIVWGLMPRPVAVDIRPVVRGPLSVTITEEGKTRVVDRYVVSAPVAGFARRVELDVGDEINRGQVLIHLDPMRSGTLDPRTRAEAAAAVRAAEAALNASNQRVEAAEAEAELARNEYERVRKVAARGLISQDALDAARARWRSTRARHRSAEFDAQVAGGELEAARAALEFSATAPGDFGDHVSVAVKAPVDGRVLAVIHESEGVVAEGQPLLELGDPRALEIEVELLSRDAVRVHEGTSVRFLRWGGEEMLKGVVRRVEPTGFTKFSALGVEEQRVLVICDINSPYEVWQSLGDGYRVEAEFVLWENDDVLQVPASALFRADGGPAVFRIADGRSRVTAITTGARNGLSVQVIDGLEPGDQVVIYPGERVSDGERVRPRS
jgi:HlyD family secretion protein